MFLSRGSERNVQKTFPVAKSICASSLTSIQICQNNQFKPPNYLYKISSTKNRANQINSIPLLEVVRNTRLYFACELQFCIGYPELAIPVPIVIVYLISYLKFT